VQLLLTAAKNLALYFQTGDLFPVELLLVLSAFLEIVVLEVYFLEAHHPLAVVPSQLLFLLTTAGLDLPLGCMHPLLVLLLDLLGEIGTCVFDEALFALKLDL
jgi:hypothetical protein